MTINSATLDTHTQDGVRISIPCYVDVPMHLRKQLLNGARSAAETQQSKNSAPPTRSGISVTTMATTEQSVESYLGVTFDVLRTVLFQRGGLPVDLILRLQAVAGMEVISTKELAKAFDDRKKLCVGYVSENPYPQVS